MLIQINDSTIYRSVANAYGLTILFLDGEGAIHQTYSPQPTSMTYLLQFSNLQNHFTELCIETQQPQVIHSDLNQTWVGLPIVEDGQVVNIVIIGPVFASEVDKDIFLDFGRFVYAKLQPPEKLRTALEQTPVYSYTDLFQPVALLYQLIQGVELDFSTLPVWELSAGQKSVFDERFTGDPDIETLKELAVSNFTFQQFLMECVREGGIEKLKRLFQNIPNSVLSLSGYGDDQLRRQKVLFLFGLPLAAHAAMEGGLEPEIAYAQVDSYIRELEGTVSLISVVALTRKMIYDFTRRVHNQRRTNLYSQTINECCNFINHNIGEKLLVTDVAAHTGYNSTYLARKFKKETGQSIPDYIHGAKIAEAKSLLKYSSLSLLEISERLAFSSQSHFTAIFGQVTGLTPSKFRENWNK